MMDDYRPAAISGTETFAPAEGGKEVEYRGLKILVTPGVFFPGEHDGCGTHFFTNALIEQNLSGRMIEIGCGAGLTGLALTKLADFDHLTACDISPLAVACTRANSRRLGIERMVSVVQSDVFDAVPDQRADVIYWNSPWLYVSERRVGRSRLDPCLYDRGYRLMERYVADSRRYVSRAGRRFVGTGRGANLPKLWDICAQNSCETHLIADRRAGDQTMLALYELMPLSGGVGVRGWQAEPVRNDPPCPGMRDGTPSAQTG